MSIRIFVSRNSGNPKIESAQQKILMVLKMRDIEFEVLDISGPGMQEARRFMREKGKKGEGQRNVIPPQIFNGEQCRGDFEDFDIANEDNVLEEFLGLPRKKPKIELVNTGRVAEDAAPRKVGKLDRKQVDDDDDDNKQPEPKELTPEPIDPTPEPILSHAESDIVEIPVQEEVKEFVKRKPKTAESTITENPLNADESQPQVLDSEDMMDMLDEIESGIESDDPQTYLDDLDKLKGENNDDDAHKKIAEEVIIDNQENKVTLLNDGCRSPLQNGDLESGLGDSDSESDFTDSESDDEVRYMPDGEVERKNSRGFKLLTNSKRFWKATIDMGHA